MIHFYNISIWRRESFMFFFRKAHFHPIYKGIPYITKRTTVTEAFNSWIYSAGTHWILELHDGPGLLKKNIYQKKQFFISEKFGFQNYVSSSEIFRFLHNDSLWNELPNFLKFSENLKISENLENHRKIILKSKFLRDEKMCFDIFFPKSRTIMKFHNPVRTGPVRAAP